MHEKVIEKLRGLEGIINCKVTGKDEVDEIHIIASKNRKPKRIVRDIETLILVNFDQKIDHKKISIAQVDEDRREIKENRVIINCIYKEHNRSVVHLDLEINDESVHEKIVDKREGSVPLMVARGIIELIELHTNFAGTIKLENVFTTGLNNEIVIVQLILCSSNSLNREKLLGAVYINNNLALATGKVCLKALNRLVNC